MTPKVAWPSYTLSRGVRSTALIGGGFICDKTCPPTNGIAPTRPTRGLEGVGTVAGAVTIVTVQSHGPRHQTALSHVTNRALAPTMPLEAVLDLSVLELLQVLNKKLGLKCTRTQDACLPPIQGSISSLETEVSGPGQLTSADVTVRSNGNPSRSKSSNPQHRMF